MVWRREVTSWAMVEGGLQRLAKWLRVLRGGGGEFAYRLSQPGWRGDQNGKFTEISSRR